MDDAQVTDLIGQMTRRGLTVARPQVADRRGLVARMVDVLRIPRRAGDVLTRRGLKASVLGVSRASIKPVGGLSRWPGGG